MFNMTNNFMCLTLFLTIFIFRFLGFIGEAVSIDDVFGGALILTACLTNEFNLYDNFRARQNLLKKEN